MAEKSGFPRTKAYALRQAGAGRQFTGLSPFPPVQIPFIFCDNYQRTPLGCPLILWRRNRDFLAPKLTLCDRPGRGDNSQDCRLFRPFKSLSFSVIIIKGHRLVSFDIMAEKSGFEPELRYQRTTPLAGEPLQPLGYFSS